MMMMMLVSQTAVGRDRERIYGFCAPVVKFYNYLVSVRLGHACMKIHIEISSAVYSSTTSY